MMVHLMVLLKSSCASDDDGAQKLRLFAVVQETFALQLLLSFGKNVKDSSSNIVKSLNLIGVNSVSSIFNESVEHLS
jgi:hypothetical protein